jgi:hypothetical protein
MQDIKVRSQTKVKVERPGDEERAQATRMWWMDDEDS